MVRYAHVDPTVVIGVGRRERLRQIGFGEMRTPPPGQLHERQRMLAGMRKA
jgi:hypothetical protein